MGGVELFHRKDKSIFKGKEVNENQEKVIVVQNQSNALGIASFVFGLISIFVLSVLFVPLALLFGILGIVKKQLVWSIVGIILALVGFATSPMLLGMFGLATVAATGAQ